MGKKIIVVGDDEQVSPLSVGLDEAKMQNLMNMLIKDKIPNAHLWDAKTSLCDIAAQVYQPLMLREHFRCVPDIIGYSNLLSYRGKIKPLREAGSSPFKTAVVPFRINGVRKGRSKTNEEEADAIVAFRSGYHAEFIYFYDRWLHHSTKIRRTKPKPAVFHNRAFSYLRKKSFFQDSVFG